MFIDEARIYIKGGAGGAGGISFRREKHVPRGGPDGGNGGKGGSIIIEVDEGLKTLMDFRYKRRFEADRGLHGVGKMKNGASGKDLLLRVPPGTLIKDDEGKILIDLTTKGQRFIAVSGGHGGKGNAYFSTSTRKAPTFAQKGEPGKELWIRFELKLLADVGIVGMPNAGKSTLISAVSAAKPKVADYPFTTLVPNLGVIKTDYFTYVMADIPGLIEGAHKGAGLGDAFLRHVDRAGLIVHMLDLSNENPINDFEIIHNELRLYSKDLAKRLCFVVGNKLDILQDQKVDKKIVDYFKKRKIAFFDISAATNKGLKLLLHALGEKVQQIRALKVEKKDEVIVTYKISEQRLSDFEIRAEEEGFFQVIGAAIERLVIMTDLDNEEAIEHLQQQFRTIKLEQKLQKSGIKEGDTVKIGFYEFNYHSKFDV